MRIALCGRNLKDIRELLTNYPVDVVSNEPDLVISYGGDGSLLGAEREYPGIPKCPIRDARTTPKCTEHEDHEILDALFEDRLQSYSLSKLSSDKNTVYETMIALNDICLHRTICSSAVRFRIWLDEELYANQIVGDGLVIASPFGSTGYYRSITNSFFQSGIGIAFNNATESVNHLVVNENRKIRVQVIRGPAILTADNDPEEVPLEAGDEITVHRHHDLTTILGLETFRCPVCYRMRHPQRPSEGELLRNLF